jgi:hypothetical protein
MNLKQTIKVLEEHNRWRRDNNVPAKTKMAEPKVLGMALDRAIEELNKGVVSDAERTLNDFFAYLDGLGDKFDSNSLDGHKRDWLKLFNDY